MKFATNLTVLLVALAAVALGQPIDPDPNGIGIFIDEGAGADTWCVSINDDTCLGGPEVPIEEQTWGTVKALYRQ